MVRVKLSVVRACALAAFAIAMAGCSTTPPDPTVGMTPQQIYAEAKEQMAISQWDKAIPFLEKLEARAAGTPLAQQAQLDRAFAHYKAAEPAQALAAIERFAKLHPSSPALDYALYLKGLVNFNDDLGFLSGIAQQDLSERDQRAAKESYDAFRDLVTRFPDSKYSIDARQRMNYVVNSLAQYEVHVARYYYRRGAYLAAVNRAQIALSDYPNTPALEEALYILYRSYDGLGMEQLRDDAKRIFDANYPKSEYLTKGLEVKKDPWWKVW